MNRLQFLKRLFIGSAAVAVAPSVVAAAIESVPADRPKLTHETTLKAKAQMDAWGYPITMTAVSMGAFQLSPELQEDIRLAKQLAESACQQRQELARKVFLASP